MRLATNDELGEAVGNYLGRTWSRQAVSAAEGGGRSFAAEELLVFSRLFAKPISWWFEPDIAQIGEEIRFSTDW